jgi:uncharacterized RDD family membrane protein YckC
MSDFGEIPSGGDGDRQAGRDPYQQYGQPQGQPPGGGPPPGALAGFWIRFASALLDGLLIGIVVSALAGLTGAGVGGDGANGLQALLSGIYFTYLHSTRAGQSVGQRICGIRLVDESSGGQVEPTKAFIRWLMSFVSAIPLGLGYFWMLWDPKKQTWHDKVAGTLVVYSRVVPPPTSSLTER